MNDYDGEDRRRDEAYAQGKREAYVAAELESHEKRLNAINGSIDRHARQAQALRESIDRLRSELADVANTLKTSQVVEQDRAAQLKRANDKQISARQFWMGVGTILVTILAAVIGAHGGVW